MRNVTVFRNFIPVENRPLWDISEDIIFGTHQKTMIEEIRLLAAEGKKEEADEKKKKLPAFTPSGTFSERKKEALETYSGFVCLDFDHLASEALKTAFAAICKIPYTAFCFVSPSGNGLKVFVSVNTEAEHHEMAYEQAQAYYEKVAGLKADDSCKDVTRLCYVSWDPGAYRTEKSEKFIVDLSSSPIEGIRAQTAAVVTSAIEIREPPKGHRFDALAHFEALIKFTDQIQIYREGNRNIYIFLLACNCNRSGLSQSYAEGQIIKRFSNLPEKEIRASVDSAYSNHPKEHGEWAPGGKFVPPAPPPPPRLPVFPAPIFEKMPLFFRHIVEAGETEEERDILLLGALATLSAAFPRLAGMYDGNLLYANFYVFISALAAEGKGIVAHCQKLVHPIHRELIKET